VFQTAHMVQLDWQRSVDAPGAVACIRQSLEKGAPSGGRIVSFARVPFPKIARYSTAFLSVVEVSGQGTTIPVTVEVVLVGQKRTEITLRATAVGRPARPVVSAATLRLARILVGRARV
jgi:hypothetical protein